MRRPWPGAALLAAALALGVGLGASACGGDAAESPEAAVDRLLDDIAAGGRQRAAAADRLAEIVDREPDAVASADPARAASATAVLVREVERLSGPGAPICGSWADTPRYADSRSVLELLIDVAGRVGARDAIRRALTLPDAYLVAWALRAADRAGVPIDPRLLARVADDPYARSVLHAGSDELVGRLPERHRTLEALARADLARWLTFPTELGCSPAELELMGELARPEGRYFVYRFLEDGGPTGGGGTFMAGVSGPWGPDGVLADRSATFSDFQPADAASPNEHLARILALLG